MIQLLYPWVLILIPLPLLFWWLIKNRQPKVTPIRTPLFSAWQSMQANHASSRDSWLFRLCQWLAWSALVVAVARIQWIDEPVELPTSGRDLLLSIDISGSMEEEDLKLAGKPTNRLNVVKSIITEFVSAREGDRIGLVLFGENAYLQTPLTFDRKTVKTLLYEAAIGLAGKSTAIGDSIGLAVKKAREVENNNRILIVLTDGQNTAGAIEPLKAAELAREEGLKIYTIGVGADEMVSNGFFGQRVINPSADLDEATLKRIAKITEGQYFRARNSNELEQIYMMLDELEPLAEDEKFFRPTDELFFWPLLAALSALMASLWIRRLG